MDILIWDGDKYSRQTYDSNIIQTFKQKYWYLCFRSATNKIIIDNSENVFTKFLTVNNE